MVGRDVVQRRRPTKLTKAAAGPRDERGRRDGWWRTHGLPPGVVSDPGRVAPTRESEGSSTGPNTSLGPPGP